MNALATQMAWVASHAVESVNILYYPSPTVIEEWQDKIVADTLAAAGRTWTAEERQILVDAAAYMPVGCTWPRVDSYLCAAGRMW